MLRRLARFANHEAALAVFSVLRRGMPRVSQRQTTLIRGRRFNSNGKIAEIKPEAAEEVQQTQEQLSKKPSTWAKLRLNFQEKRVQRETQQLGLYRRAVLDVAGSDAALSQVEVMRIASQMLMASNKNTSAFLRGLFTALITCFLTNQGAKLFEFFHFNKDLDNKEGIIIKAEKAVNNISVGYEKISEKIKDAEKEQEINIKELDEIQESISQLKIQQDEYEKEINEVSLDQFVIVGTYLLGTVYIWPLLFYGALGGGMYLSNVKEEITEKLDQLKLQICDLNDQKERLTTRREQLIEKLGDLYELAGKKNNSQESTVIARSP